VSFSSEELERYSRQIVLKAIGTEGQARLKNARVCVVGIGGLGCVSALQLTAMGVGYIRLVDQDVVDLTNLHRQPVYDVSSIGYPKVEVAEKKLKSLNPNVETDPLTLIVDSNTAESIVKGVEVVVDGLDRFVPRYAINRACLKLKVPYVFGGAIETYGNVSTIIPGETACL
jgi:adenylyltransferase/sulfurtransferase